MENEILDVILHYSSKKRILDSEAISEIINILVRHYGIQNFFDKTIFLDNSSKNISLAQYNKDTHEIRLFFDPIIDYIHFKSHEKFKSLDYVYMNLLIIQSILHELGHAFQEKLETETKDTLLKDILTYESIIFNCRNDEYYNKTYKYNPRERMAEIISNKEIGAIAGCHSQLYKDLFYNEANHLLLYGYDNNHGCPLKKYFDKNEFGYIWDNLEYQFYFSLLTKPTDYRMTLGLPIIKAEYKALLLKSK